MRVGLVGTGYWVTHKRQSGRVDLVIWGRDLAARTEAARLSGTRAYALSADCSTTSTPCRSPCPRRAGGLRPRGGSRGQAPAARESLAAGVEEADRRCAVMSERRLASIVFFTSRFQPQVARWLTAVGKQGRLARASATWSAPVLDDPRSPFRDSAWGLSRGPLWDMGPHLLSRLLPILGVASKRRASGRGGGDVVFLLEHTPLGPSIRSPCRCVAPRIGCPCTAGRRQHLHSSRRGRPNRIVRRLAVNALVEAASIQRPVTPQRGFRSRGGLLGLRTAAMSNV